MHNFYRLLSIGFVLATVSLLLIPSVNYAAAQVSSCGGDFRILQGSDDAEEKRNDGSMILVDTLDLDLAQHEVGVRFHVTVPQGAIITKAFIQFTAEKDDEETNSAGVFIFAEDADNSQTFSTNTNDITSRAKTISQENWFIPQWTLSGTDAGPAQRTPDLSSLVQEVVNRGGWSSNNAMSFIFITYNDGDRDTKTFESDNPNQHDDNAALLHIECLVPDPNVCQDVLLNFDGLPHGARLGNPDGSEQQTIHSKLAPFGIEASGIANNPNDPPGQGLDTLIVYDSHFSRPSSTGNPDSSTNVGEDPDLEHPFNPNADPLVEGVPIIPTTEQLCDEKPSILTMKYTGDNNPTSHSQPVDKVNVDGTTGNDPEVFIIASSKVDPNDSTAKIFFSGTVTLGSTFEIDSNNAGSSKLDSRTFVLVYSDATQNTLLQSIEFHTSCSQPLFLGDQFGSVQVVGFVDINGVGNNPSGPFASPNDWRNGGTATYQFDHDRILKKLTGVDDLNTIASMVTVFSDRDCTQQIGLPIPIDQNDDDRGTHVYDFEDISGVRCIKEFYPSSGGITNIDLGCVPTPVCADLPPPDTSGVLDNEVLFTLCLENPVQCTGVTFLTLSYNGPTPATITAKDNRGVLTTVTIDQLPGSITVTADDVPGKNELPPNTTFTIATFDDSSSEILVADDNTNAIIKVDPATGKQTLVSDHRNFDDPENVLIDNQGRTLVAEGDFPNGDGSILMVNPDGTVSIFASGGFFNDGPEDLVEDAFGNIYVLDDGARAVFKVDTSGNQLGFATFGFKPEGIAIDDDGNIIVVGGSGNGARVISIDPDTKVQTIVSKNQLLVRPEGVAFDSSSGFIYVADGNASDENNPSQSRGQIVRVDPNDPDTPNSNQELISPTGPPFVDPSDVEISAGKLIISDDAAGEDGMGAIIELNPLDRNDWRIISSNPISKANSGAELFDSPEGLFIGQSITQEDIRIHTSCSQDINVGDVHGSLTITELCKTFDNGQEQCFTTTGGPYDSLPLEVQYEGTNVDTNSITPSGYSGGSSYSKQKGDSSYTEEPDIITNEGEQGAFLAEENFVGVIQGEENYYNQGTLGKTGNDIISKLQQEGVNIDKRLQSLLEKFDSGKYFGTIPRVEVEPKSYILSIGGSASSLYDSTLADFSGEIYLETLVTGDYSSKFIVTDGQLIIGDVSYEVLFGKAKSIYSTKGDSIIILAELLDNEGKVNTLRISFKLESSLQGELSEPIYIDIAYKSKIAHNWNLAASGQLSNK